MQLNMAVVMVSLHRCLLDRAVYPFDLYGMEGITATVAVVTGATHDKGNASAKGLAKPRVHKISAGGIRVGGIASGVVETPKAAATRNTPKPSDASW